MDVTGTIIAANDVLGPASRARGRRFDWPEYIQSVPKELSRARRLWAQKVVEGGEPVRVAKTSRQTTGILIPVSIPFWPQRQGSQTGDIMQRISQRQNMPSGHWQKARPDTGSYSTGSIPALSCVMPRPLNSWTRIAGSARCTVIHSKS